MCLILTAYKAHPDYDLIVLANRDEFFARPSLPAHWWAGEHGNILAGRDLLAGGTWLGLTQEKRFSALTNYRDPANFRPGALSRGNLVTEYLKTDMPAREFGRHYLQDVDAYNDFNLILYEGDRLYYYNSLQREMVGLDAGIYGLSNHLLNTPWPKVSKGMRRLEDMLSKGIVTPEAAFNILSDKTLARDEELPDTGVGLDKERLLSAMHIEYPGYGTRSSNILFFSKDGSVKFYEADHLTGQECEFVLN